MGGHDDMSIALTVGIVGGAVMVRPNTMAVSGAESVRVIFVSQHGF